MSNAHHHNQCRELFAQLSDYIDRELDEQTCRQIEAHVGDCIPCSVCMKTLQKTVDICRGLHDEPVPPDFSQRLQKLIGQLGGKS